MIFTHEITLDTTYNEIKIINIKQYTKDSFLLHVNLTDRGEPFHADKDSLKCYFKMETPDKKHIFTDAIINDDGTVDVPIPEKACLTAGSGTAEVVFVTSEIASRTQPVAEDGSELSDHSAPEFSSDYGTHSQDGAVFATMNLNINIVESSYNNNHITSSDDFDALHSALLAANKTYDYVMTSANASANAARQSEDNAAASESSAAASADNAAFSADNAAASALLAKSYAVGDTGLNDRENEDEDCAKSYCEKAKQSKEASVALALLAKSYAVGDTGLNDRENENEDCAKNYCENARKAKDAAAASASLAQSYAESFSGALRPIDTIPFAELPPIANASKGDMYNISDQFTTDNRFREGAGLTIPLGANVYKTTDGQWDILAGSPVAGVKGHAEDSYRKGNVNITPANIGLGNVDNTADKDKSVKYAVSAGSAATATRAAQDGDGNVIKNSYVRIETNGNLLDFDSFTIPGFYNIINPTHNLPTTNASKFTLIVTAGSLSHQISMPDAINELYVRTRIANGTWTSWVKLLDSSGGTITGNLRLKGSGNYGNMLNFGDGDHVHISEPTDDNLEIKAKNVNFVTTAGLTLNNKKILTIDEIYPIGSIYMSVNSTSPATLFGGTWAAWGTGRVPVGVDTSQTDFNTVEKTGGAVKSSYTPTGSVGSHTLTTDEIPSHKHSVSVSGGSCTISSSGSHTHQVKGSSTGASGTSKAIINGQGDKHYAAVESSGAHTHTVPNHTHTATETNTGGSKGHTHTFAGTAAEISAMQPYITCYMWKRTA